MDNCSGRCSSDSSDTWLSSTSSLPGAAAGGVVVSTIMSSSPETETEAEFGGGCSCKRCLASGGGGGGGGGSGTDGRPRGIELDREIGVPAECGGEAEDADADAAGGQRLAGRVYEHWYVDLPPRVRSSRMAARDNRGQVKCNS